MIHFIGSQLELLEGLKVFIRQANREGDLQKHRGKNQLRNTEGVDGTEAEGVSAR